MRSRAALLSALKAIVMMLMILGQRVNTAPTKRGQIKLPDPHPSVTYASAPPHKSLALNPSQYLKQWFLSTKASGADGLTKTTDTTVTTNGFRSERRAGPDKRAQILKMISALEDLHRTYNSTLSTRITIIPRANGRNSGKKNKLTPVADGVVKPTTQTPSAVNVTASRASADALVPSLTGRNFRKSLPPQPKKTNKRVCFWKYCSQN